MTMYYSPSEENYVAARVAYDAQMRNQAPKQVNAVQTVTEMPDMNEAERIWKLLKDAAQS